MKNQSTQILALLHVLEANATELMELVSQLDPTSELGIYAGALLGYFQGRQDVLQNALEKSPQDSDLSKLICLRIAIRENKSTALEIPALGTSLWDAETAIVWAIYLETQNLDQRARELYLTACSLFTIHGALKKAAKSFHNAVAAESRIDPKRRLIPEYQEALRRAEAAADFTTAATALNNLSREFQIMKAPRVALRYATQAIESLRSNAYASYSFYMALCHRAHLHLELGHIEAAATDYEESSVSTFPEVQASLAVIRSWLESKNCKLHSQKLSAPCEPRSVPTWTERSRLSLIDTRSSLSDLESRVILELSKGAKTRFELIEALWGTSENPFDLENRLKQLIHRIRKKDDSLISYMDGRYCLMDATGSAHQLSRARP